jgi:hypothetical protein
MIGTMISESLALSLGYAERLLKEIPRDQFARFAAPGGIPVPSNHPAFVFGHLALYPQRILGDLGGEGNGMVPKEFLQVFSKDAQCQDDPFGTIYPEMDLVTDVFFKVHRTTMDFLPQVPDEKFLLPNMNEAMRKRFSTVGAMHAFYCGGHIMMHLGQISAWRRMRGLAPA